VDFNLPSNILPWINIYKILLIAFLGDEHPFIDLDIYRSMVDFLLVYKVTIKHLLGILVTIPFHLYNFLGDEHPFIPAIGHQL
jgi:hypothetical protein